MVKRSAGVIVPYVLPFFLSTKSENSPLRSGVKPDHAGKDHAEQAASKNFEQSSKDIIDNPNYGSKQSRSYIGYRI